MYHIYVCWLFLSNISHVHNILVCGCFFSINIFTALDHMIIHCIHVQEYNYIKANCCYTYKRIKNNHTDWICQGLGGIVQTPTLSSILCHLLNLKEPIWWIKYSSLNIFKVHLIICKWIKSTLTFFACSIPLLTTFVTFTTVLFNSCKENQ